MLSTLWFVRTFVGLSWSGRCACRLQGVEGSGFMGYGLGHSCLCMGIWVVNLGTLEDVSGDKLSNVAGSLCQCGRVQGVGFRS